MFGRYFLWQFKSCLPGRFCLRNNISSSIPCLKYTYHFTSLSLILIVFKLFCLKHWSISSRIYTVQFQWLLNSKVIAVSTIKGNYLSDMQNQSISIKSWIHKVFRWLFLELTHWDWISGWLGELTTRVLFEILIIPRRRLPAVKQKKSLYPSSTSMGDMTTCDSVCHSSCSIIRCHCVCNAAPGFISRLPLVYREIDVYDLH